MNIIKMELESCRVEIAKLKSENKKLSLKVSQIKLFLDSMQSTIVDVKKKLQEMLAIGEKFDANKCNIYIIKFEFYSGIMKKTKLDYEELVFKYDIHEGRIVKFIKKLATLEMHFDALTFQMLL